LEKRQDSLRIVPPGVVLPGILRVAPHARSVIVLARNIPKAIFRQTTCDCGESSVPPFEEGWGCSQLDYLLGFSCVSPARKEIVNNL
jgi:hypothetical protein